MNRIALFCAAFAWAGAAWGQWPEVVVVAALPELNVRSWDLGQIRKQLPDGTPISRERLAHTHQFATLNGLSGEWLALDDTLRIFDAYLSVVDPPACATDSTCEWLGEYSQRVVDGDFAPRAFAHHENAGGPSEDTYGLEVRCTAGQALNLFRRLVGNHIASSGPLPAEAEASWRRIAAGPWDGSTPLVFSWPSEGGSTTFALRPTASGFLFEYAVASC